MQMFTFGWWRWRFTQALGRNPLVRASDRVEAIVMAIAVVVALTVIPVAGAMATAIHDERGRAYVAQLEDRRQVVATVAEDSVRVPRTETTIVQARWQYAGVQHAERFQWDRPVRAGQTIEIWVHPNGERAPELDPWWRAGVDAAVGGITFWLAATGSVALMVGVLRPWLTRMRNAAWEREIASLADDGGTANRHS